jgi:hypothetical protein
MRVQPLASHAQPPLCLVAGAQQDGASNWEAVALGVLGYVPSIWQVMREPQLAGQLPGSCRAAATLPLPPRTTPPNNTPACLPARPLLYLPFTQQPPSPPVPLSNHATRPPPHLQELLYPPFTQRAKQLITAAFDAAACCLDGPLQGTLAAAAAAELDRAGAVHCAEWPSIYAGDAAAGGQLAGRGSASGGAAAPPLPASRLAAAPSLSTVLSGQLPAELAISPSGAWGLGCGGRGGAWGGGGIDTL